MGNPKQAFVDEHFTVTVGTADGPKELQRLQCSYCKKYEIRRHVPRLKIHLLECPDTPAEVKELIQMRIERKEIESLSKPKRVRLSYRSPQDEDDYTSDDDDMGGNNQVVKILTKLLDSKKGSDSGEKRKLSEMTSEQLDREQKEQSIRLTRLKCEQVQESTKMCSALVIALQSIAKSAETLAYNFKPAVDNLKYEDIHVYPDMDDGRSVADQSVANSEFVAAASRAE